MVEIADLLEALGRLLDISILFSKTKTVVKILIILHGEVLMIFRKGYQKLSLLMMQGSRVQLSLGRKVIY